MSGSVEDIIMKRKVTERTDFISDLPSSILHHILSYLSFKESVRTSVLSKQWNSVKKSFPILDIKQPVRKSSPRFKERLRECLDYVDRSLQRFVRDKLCIERLNLDVTLFDQGSVQLVSTWLPLALHNGVSDLIFHVIIDLAKEGYYFRYYPLPETSFAVNSSLLSGSSEFFLLKKLELSRVFLTEKIVQDIIHNCPNLRDLHLSSFYGVRILNISKHKKLESLTIIVMQHSRDLTLEGISVAALSLQRFSLEFNEHYLPCEIDLTSCCNLREFELIDSSITDAQFNRHISRFPLLEVLNITSCFILRRMRISLQQLKHLEIKNCEIEAIEIDAPILSKFVYIAYDVIEEIHLLVDAIPDSMHFSYQFSGTPFDSFWFLKIREFLSLPFKSTFFDLHRVDYSSQISFDLDELRERVIPPPVEIDCLDLTHLGLIYPSYWEAFLDGLLWSCHPKKLHMTMTARTNADDNFVKALWRMLTKSECQICSNLSHCMCWRSRFKAATIKSTGDIEFDYLNVKSVTEHLLSNPKYRRKRSRSAARTVFPQPITCNVKFTLYWES